MLHNINTILILNTYNFDEYTTLVHLIIKYTLFLTLVIVYRPMFLFFMSQQCSNSVKFLNFHC